MIKKLFLGFVFSMVAVLPFAGGQITAATSTPEVKEDAIAHRGWGWGGGWGGRGWGGWGGYRGWGGYGGYGGYYYPYYYNSYYPYYYYNY